MLEIKPGSKPTYTFQLSSTDISPLVWSLYLRKIALLLVASITNSVLNIIPVYSALVHHFGTSFFTRFVSNSDSFTLGRWCSEAGNCILGYIFCSFIWCLLIILLTNFIASAAGEFILYYFLLPSDPINIAQRLLLRFVLSCLWERLSW